MKPDRISPRHERDANHPSMTSQRGATLSRAAIVRLSGVPDADGRIPALFVLPLRLLLGATFSYAGLQKLTDTQFFSPTAPGFIGRQLSGFVHSGSPLAPLLTHLAIPHAAVFGALIAFCELWVGLSALLGLLTRLGALGGLALSLTLYLTATWSVHPYFLGADLPYALGWLTLLLAGPGPYSLDGTFVRPLAREQTGAARPLPRSERRSPSGALPALADTARPAVIDPVSRAAVVRALGTAAVVLVGGGLIGSIAKLRTPNRVFTGTTRALGSAQSTAAAAGSTAAPTATAAGGTGATPAGYALLGNARKLLPPNSAGQYTDPISGDPALLVHLPNGQFVAYDAVCTHAGCTVQYDPTQRELVCPCHGAVFDPAHGAQVLAGPAPQPLAALQVKIDAQGNAFAKA